MVKIAQGGQFAATARDPISRKPEQGWRETRQTGGLPAQNGQASLPTPNRHRHHNPSIMVMVDGPSLGGLLDV